MMDPTTDNAAHTGDPGKARASLEALRAEIAKAVVGQDPAVTGLVVALLCRGHVLLELRPAAGRKPRDSGRQFGLGGSSAQRRRGPG